MLDEYYDHASVQVVAIRLLCVTELAKVLAVDFDDVEGILRLKLD